MSSDASNQHSGGHNGPPSGEVFVMPEPWRPGIDPWKPKVYTGPARTTRHFGASIDPTLRDAAAALANRHKGQYGSFTEPAPGAPRKRASR